MKIYLFILVAWWILGLGFMLSKDGTPRKGNNSFGQLLFQFLTLVPMFYWAYCWVSQS